MRKLLEKLDARRIKASLPDHIEATNIQNAFNQQSEDRTEDQKDLQCVGPNDSFESALIA